MPKRFNVVISKQDGGVELYPMKEWLRQHREYIPENLDPTHSTSHQLRNALRKRGWAVQETTSEVRVVPPDAAGKQIAIDQVLGTDDDNQLEEASDASFVLEAHLRDFIAQNIEMMNVGGARLRLFVDQTGRDGVEYPSAVGPIDILATDEAGTFYVFELKRASSPDHAIGQVARYMGWVKQTIGRDKRVQGVIVAKSINDKLRYAVSVVPNVNLFEYELQFTLRDANRLLDKS